jgi:hypothetical protein
MLSAAKHLQYLLENWQMQILRFAQDDIAGEFFSILLNVSSRDSHLSPLIPVRIASQGLLPTIPGPGTRISP